MPIPSHTRPTPPHTDYPTLNIMFLSRNNKNQSFVAVFQDERCSFSVHMWNLHIQALQHDLWKFAPPAKAQFILSNLVQHSLSLLSLRYGNAIPSYNRVKQFRSDVTAILLCTSSFLWPCCSSIQALLDTRKEETMISSIHNMCSCLLATMVSGIEFIACVAAL